MKADAKRQLDNPHINPKNMEGSMEYYNQGCGNYVIAAGDCVVNFLTPYLDDMYTAQQVKNHMVNNVNRLLISYGTGLTQKSQLCNRTKKITKVVDKIRKCPFTDQSNLVVDSGGFQVCMGYVPTSNIPEYLDMYTQFIEQNQKNISMCFTLDLPISRTGIFSTYDQMEQYNDLSYSRFATFPQEIKDKLYYIHHYSSPSVYKMWLKFLNEKDYANGYTNFSAPPSIANSATSYSIPLSDIVEHCNRHGISKFNFHALGCSSPIDIFTYQLLAKHILNRHGVEVNITYDSSTLFKGIAVGRTVHVFKLDGMLYNGDIHSATLHCKFQKEKTLCETMYDSINEMSQHYGFKQIDPSTYPFYDPITGKTNMKVYSMLILQQMNVVRRIELMCQQVVDETYQLYANGDVEGFIDACTSFLSKFFQGKTTKKIRECCCSLPRAMKVLEGYDVGFNKYIVNNNTKDFTNMTEDILTI